MLSNKLVVTGYSDGVSLVELEYNAVLTLEQVNEICEVLRKPINEIGERVTFNIIMTDDNF